jgi:hypothetical protein
MNMEKSMAAVASSKHMEADEGYQQLERLVADRVASARYPLFYTEPPEELFLHYLASIDSNRRKHYECHSCKRFFEKYGSVVMINDDGSVKTLLWEPDRVPEFFQDSLAAMRRATLAHQISGVFLNSDKVWGTPQTGVWTHLSGTPDGSLRFGHALKNCDQMMAEKREDFGTLKHGLHDYPLPIVEQAVTILKADTLSRSEKAIGVAEWLFDLHTRLEGAKGNRRDNIIWLAVATAPPGFCHIRSTMISTLLDDLKSGISVETIRRKWQEKMHPLQYQRPTKISDGAIKQAEEAIQKLGATGALKRRFAKMEDVFFAQVPTQSLGVGLNPGILWLPREVPEEKRRKDDSGIFQHLSLSKKPQKELELPAKEMTWEKFSREVLPEAFGLEFYVPNNSISFYGMVTAEDPTSPPILQWDGLEGMPRNPVSWYYYHNGSYPSQWNLTAGEWVKIKAILNNPCHWQQPEKFTHQGECALLVLEGCKDTAHKAGGLFFPEMLRSEYHNIRQVMEKYANTSPISGKDEGDANGVGIQKGQKYNFRIRAKLRGGMATYILDRWD